MDRSKWEYKKLGDICKSINAGGTPSRGNSAYWNGNIPWVKIKDMNSKYVKSTEEFITEEGLNNSSAKLFEPGTILYSIFATIGAASILEIPATTNQAIAGIVLGDGCDRDFYYYYLTSLKTHFENISKGVAQNNINLSVLRNQKVVVPPISDQQRIVAELDCLNEMIAVKKEQLKEFDKLAQSIFYDMFGDPIEDEKGWNHCLLKDVSLTITDGDHMPPPKSESGVPFVTISNVDKDTRQIDFSSTFFVPREYYDIIPESKKPQVGDVLYTVTGSYGIPILIRENKEFCFQRHIGLIRPNKDVEPVFLCMWAGCQSVKKHADRYATGVAQKTVSLKVLRNFPMIVPPLALQQEFADKISAIEAQKELVKQSIAETQALLDYTMDKYFG